MLGIKSPAPFGAHGGLLPVALAPPQRSGYGGRLRMIRPTQEEEEADAEKELVPAGLDSRRGLAPDISTASGTGPPIGPQRAQQTITEMWKLEPKSDRMAALEHIGKEEYEFFTQLTRPERLEPYMESVPWQDMDPFWVGRGRKVHPAGQQMIHQGNMQAWACTFPLSVLQRAAETIKGTSSFYRKTFRRPSTTCRSCGGRRRILLRTKCW